MTVSEKGLIFLPPTINALFLYEGNGVGINFRQRPNRDDTLKNRLESVQDTLGLDYGEEQDSNESEKTGNRRGSYQSGGQRRVYAAPDDMEDPTDAIWIIPDEDGNAYVHEEPNPQSPRVRPATEEEVQRSLEWDDRTLEIAKSVYGSEHNISQDALQELRLFPEQARQNSIWRGRIGSPSTLNTN